MDIDTELTRLAHPDAATECLAQHLGHGSLALVLGAGVSHNMGLPTWLELLERGFRAVGVTPPASMENAPELAGSQLEEACRRANRDLRDIVAEALYGPELEVSRDALVTNGLLSALGAMLMGSRRGSVDTVITFNFDSILEEYLRLHGYDTRVITNIPSLTGFEDVTIYHPHGYLPSKGIEDRRSAEIVLTKDAMNARLGNPNEPWAHLIRSTSREKVLLLIGISEHSTVGGQLGPVLTHEAGNGNGERPLGFWVSGDAMKEEYRGTLRRQKLVPVQLGSHQEIGPFLLGVCQSAARTMGRVWFR